jgi:transcriptional regulator of acetoin/glycerol metabolism
MGVVPQTQAPLGRRKECGLPDRLSQNLRVAAARADFLESGAAGAAGVSQSLAASWVRSQAAGVDTMHPRSDLTDIDTGSRLVRCAAPVIEQLGQDTSSLPLVIALTDNHARILRRVDSSAAVGRLLDRVDFAPGFNYAESTMGTNGVGTVLESGQPFSVVGAEHFTEQLQPFACTGAPIIDPLTGRCEGILDISAMAEAWSPLMHTLVKSAAKDIGRNLLTDRSQAQRALFDTYLRADARSGRRAVFAFAESVFMANAAAGRLFGPAEQLAIREHAAFIMGHRHTANDTLTLATGQVVQMRGTRLLVGNDASGIVVIAEVIEQRGELARLHLPSTEAGFADHLLPQTAVANDRTRLLLDDLERPHVPISQGSSPAWVRACAELRSAIADGIPTIVLGETGSGKFTLVAELFHAEHPGGRSISVDASQLNSDARTDLDALLRETREQTLCIVRNMDAASTEGVDRLDTLFRALGDHRDVITFIATVSDSSLDSDLPFRALLDHFEVAVTAPALRFRTDDLGAITSRLLQELAPARRVRLSPGAERTIARYSWPRNVTQLREALQHALRTRPVGEIQDQDLPAYCHTASRRLLSPLATAERDAIVAALREHHGNRVVAASHLGMSRSSLYRKLRTYNITA